ncbi:MAG: DNA/RNA helicase domain-containing protein [Chitinophagaceae bacterium]
MLAYIYELMKRHYYSNIISGFCSSSTQEILGELVQNSEFSVEVTQKDSWLEQVKILKTAIYNYEGAIFFEYSIPRMGRRIDTVLVIENVIFVLEFKVGEKEFLANDIDQVWDYALDLKNFHETSHKHLVAPILIATEAKSNILNISTTSHNDNLLFPVKTNAALLKETIEGVLSFADGETINTQTWAGGRYSPTPTIIEAAMALYNNHSVAEISRSDAGATNLTDTSNAIKEIIFRSKANNEKAICFVTGVPGAGKTLVGLDIATKYLDKENDLTSVFLFWQWPFSCNTKRGLD